MPVPAKNPHLDARKLAPHNRDLLGRYHAASIAAQQQCRRADRLQHRLDIERVGKIFKGKPLYKAVGDISGNLKIEDIVDTSYAEQAIKELGKQGL